MVDLTIYKRTRLLPSAKRRIALRKELWPDVPENMLWDRKKFRGFTFIPRTLSLVVFAINVGQSKRAGTVYLDLWCRAFDDMVVDVRDEYEVAYSAGYEGSRGISSWRSRMAILEELGFILCDRNPSGALRYALLLDPHPIMRRLRDEDKVESGLYLHFRHLMLEIGARDDELPDEESHNPILLPEKENL